VLAARGDGEASSDVDRRGLERGTGRNDAPAGVAQGTAQGDAGDHEEGSSQDEVVIELVPERMIS